MIKKEKKNMIYLDNAACEQPKKEVIQVVNDVLTNHWGNASSAYQFGVDSSNLIDNAKNIIAKHLNCDADELIWTSCASEANAMVIDGLRVEGIHGYTNDTLVTSRLEHSSIYKNDNWDVSYIGCDNNGFYKEGDLWKCEGQLVALSYVNSEIGTIQDVKRIVEILHNSNCLVLIDCVQALGKLPINIRELDVDFASFTGQKIGGIVGTGVLYVKKGLELKSIIHGTQNDGLRGGTYNTAAIAAFGKAIELIDFDKVEYVKGLREYAWNQLKNTFGDNVVLNGTYDFNRRVCGNLNFRLKGVKAQDLVAMLSMRDICVSAGSACSSYIASPSKVLKAIGLSDQEAFESIRVSLSESNTYDEIDCFVKILKNIYFNIFENNN